MPVPKIRVWWIPQVPGKPFYVPVDTVEDAVKILTTLAKYDAFQFENKIKGDYCNAGGLMEEDAEFGWTDWCDEETGETCPFSYVRNKKNLNGESNEC